MKIEDRISAIEVELQQTKDELQKILVDIRAYLAETPGSATDTLDDAKIKTERG